MFDIIQQAVQTPPVRSLYWLQDFQQRGRALWQHQSLPTRKTEAWKYTNLRQLEQGNYFSGFIPEPANDTDLASGLRDQFAIAGLNPCATLVFFNGQFNAVLSTVSSLPAGATLAKFSDANEDEAALISDYLGRAVDSEQHLFTSLNDSQLADGVFLKVAKNVRLEKPVQLVWISTRQKEAFAVSQRLLVVLKPGSEATVIEQFVTDASRQNSFTNGVSEFYVQPNAKLRHYRLHLEQEDALHIGGAHFSLERDAQLDSFHLALGSTLKRIDVVVNHRGEGAHCKLTGVYLPRNQQHVDYHTCIEHAVPHCTTDEVFRGIIGDNARAVFNGRIHIHPNAQKTLAQLSNKNLLTSDKAEVDTKPELEIYADDVQCAHGATVAQLDERSLHYLRTRGVSRDEARIMLSFGFINELINGVKDPQIADYLRPLLSGLFTRDPKLTRHIA